MTTYGSGGPHGARVWWPVGLQEMTPGDRALALARGYWLHEGEIVHRDGWKLPYSSSMRRAYPLVGSLTSATAEAT